MDKIVSGWRSWMSVVVVSSLSYVAAPLTAQAQEQKEEKGGSCCAQGGGSCGEHGECAPGQEKGAQMHKMHEQMEAMRKEMETKLHVQLNALREHAKKMDGISDEKALLPELKKHQQMTDEFLGSMMEFHEKMRAHRKAHHEHMGEHHEHMRHHHHMHHGEGESKKPASAPESPAKE